MPMELFVLMQRGTLWPELRSGKENRFWVRALERDCMASVLCSSNLCIKRARIEFMGSLGGKIN
jgi:hypothetical protein